MSYRQHRPLFLVPDAHVLRLSSLLPPPNQFAVGCPVLTIPHLQRRRCALAPAGQRHSAICVILYSQSEYTALPRTELDVSCRIRIHIAMRFPPPPTINRYSNSTSFPVAGMYLRDDECRAACILGILPASTAAGAGDDELDASAASDLALCCGLGPSRDEGKGKIGTYGNGQRTRSARCIPLLSASPPRRRGREKADMGEEAGRRVKSEERRGPRRRAVAWRLRYSILERPSYGSSSQTSAREEADKCAEPPLAAWSPAIVHIARALRTLWRQQFSCHPPFTCSFLRACSLVVAPRLTCARRLLGSPSAGGVTGASHHHGVPLARSGPMGVRLLLHGQRVYFQTARSGLTLLYSWACEAAPHVSVSILFCPLGPGSWR
ncbi:hypothetical protein B0H13DRAFT_2428945 [Mycena leptocephala]|nr:hypothetical protein B0H13DRAFT_2428945 [Mycena leptocephala]